VEAALRLIPASPGVYLMRDRDRRVLYVGRSVSLRPRVRSYWRDLGDHAHLRPMLSRVVELEPILTESEQEAAFLERNLLEHLRPRHNRTMGVESPIYLRLDTGPDDPGLELLHEPGADTPEVRHFGPHLGWSPTTIAVQALGRLHPLAYAAEGLAGSGRELGRGRGVEPAERGALGAQIAAVLERWPVPSSSRPRAGCSSSSTPWTGSPSRRRRSRSPRRTSTSSATPAASGR
jgi:excinuclease ABC subunit C